MSQLKNRQRAHFPFLHLLFYSGLMLIGWRALRHSLGFTEATNSNVNFVAEQSLSPVPNTNTDRVLGKGEKKSLYCFARQRRPQQANALKTVPPLGETRRWAYSFAGENMATDKDQGEASLPSSSKLVFSGPRTGSGSPPSFWNKECFIK